MYHKDYSFSSYITFITALEPIFKQFYASNTQLLGSSSLYHKILL